MKPEPADRSRLLGHENDLLHRQLAASQLGTREAKDSRLAALNLLEDATLARELAERTGDALRESERELRLREAELVQVQRAGGVAGVVIDLSDGDYVGYRSAEYRRLHGLAPEVTEERHEDWQRRLHPDDRERADRALREALAGSGNTYESEYRIIRPIDGEERWILAKADIERDDGGTPVRLIGAHIDITHRKRTEEALLENEERLRVLFDGMAEAFVIKEAILDESGRAVDYRYIDCNPAFVRETGLENAIGHTVRELIPDIEPIWLESYEKVLRTGKPVKFQAHLAAIGRWLDVSATRLGGLGSLRVAIVFSDITERRNEDARKNYLFKLSDSLRSLADPTEIQFTAMQVLGQHLGVSRSQYYEVTPDGECLVTTGGYADGVPSVTGALRMDEFGIHVKEAFQAGHTVAVADVSTDSRISKQELASYDALGFPAYVGIPLVKGGRFVATLGLHHATPRVWTDDELTLAEETAQRTWAALERARAEAALRVSEERLSGFFERAEVGISEISAAGRFLRVNEALCQMLGRTRAEMLSAQVQDVTYPGDLSCMETAFPSVLETGHPVSLDKRYFRADGGIIWANSRLSRLDHGLEPPTVLAVTADLTARHEAERQMRASEERLRLIVENARDYAIVALDLDRRVTSWNSGAERLLGWTEPEILGGSADVIFTEEDQQRGVPKEEAQTAILKDRAADERWHVRKDGTRFWGSGVMTVMRDTNGVAVGLVKIFRDQTIELLSKEEAEQARADAEAANQAKDHFLAVLSHELRTPLSPVLMTLKSLSRQDDISDRARRQLEVIRRNVRIQTQLIDDLLDVTRIVRGKFEIVRQHLDLHDAIREALEVVQSDVDAKRQIVISALAAPDSSLEGDSARLQQAVWNLLRNASKFTPEGGEIKVTTRTEAQTVIVEVSDTGIGFAAELAPTLFEPFTQGGRSITRQFGGLGLGLAIAKAVIEAHGGELSCWSSGVGRGSTFAIFLPLRRAEGKI